MPENSDPFAPEPPAEGEHPTQRIDPLAQTAALPPVRPSGAHASEPAARQQPGQPPVSSGQGGADQHQNQDQNQQHGGQNQQQQYGGQNQNQNQNQQQQQYGGQQQPLQTGRRAQQQPGQPQQGPAQQGPAQPGQPQQFRPQQGAAQPGQSQQFRPQQGATAPGYGASARPGPAPQQGQAPQHGQGPQMGQPGAYPGAQHRPTGYGPGPGFGAQAGATQAGATQTGATQPSPFGTQGAAASSGTKRNSWWPALIAGALAGALIGGGTAWAVAAAAPQGAVISNGGSTVIQNPQSVTSAGAAAAKALPSVVTITVVNGSKGGSGSGIVLDKEGHILTNQHVATLAGTTSKGAIEVMLSDGTVLPATLVGQDPLYDLAVIKIQAQNLTPITWADMSKLNVGDTTVAIGAPLGLPNSVSDGVVSNLDRSIPVASSAVPKSEGDDSNPFANPDQDGGTSTQKAGQVSLNVIQTDAAINHGNSGGALVNAAGELIGVNVAIYSPSEEGGSIGLGFAVRGNVAQRVSQELIANGTATHGQLGVTIQSNSARQAGKATGFTTGARVATATADSPAGKAGVQSGDVIVGVGGKRVVDATDVTATVRSYAAGTEVPIKVKRGDNEMEFKVTLGAASVG